MLFTSLPVFTCLAPSFLSTGIKLKANMFMWLPGYYFMLYKKIALTKVAYFSNLYYSALLQAPKGSDRCGASGSQT
jgi:hypothetical protein